jgi:predicted TIM-barrel fold metal-dependent hydrolase
MAFKIGAIDAWGGVLGEGQVHEWPESIKHIFRRYGTIEKLEKGYGPEEMIREMDRNDVQYCIITAFEFGPVHITNEMVAEMVKRYPDRFIGSGTINPMQKPMKVIRDLEHMVNGLGIRILRLEPYAYGDGMRGTPPNDKMYWPIYAKCCELDVPVAIQVGHTGPLLPSDPGRPIYLDEVALAFPELTIVGCHLGQPWHEEMMILAWKHPNVYIETSARTPRYFPRSFVSFINSYGHDKALYGTDYPLLSYDRTIAEVDELGLSEVSRRNFLRENAIRAFKLKV